MNPPDLRRKLEESERERRGLLEALQDTLQLQRMAEEAGSTRDPRQLLEAFAQAAGRICAWSAVEVRLRSGLADPASARCAFRSGCDPDIDAEIREMDEEGLLEWARGNARPSTLPPLSANGTVGWLLLPLLVQGEDVGIALLRPVDRSGPNARQLEMLRLVASQTAVALDNLEHVREIRRGYAELRSIHRVSAALGRTLDPQGLFEALLPALRERLDPKVVGLGIGTGEELRVLCDGVEAPCCADLLRRIRSSPTILRMDPALAAGRGLEGLGCRRAIGVPLASASGFPLGGLLLADSGEEELEGALASGWIESVAGLLASALDNSRLYEEVVAANRRMADLQSRMIQVGRLEGIGQLAGGIAHEINNPLQVILGRVQILQARAGESPALLADLSRIETETMRIAHIVRGLQSFARQDGGERAGNPVRLSQIADSVLELVAHRIRRQGIELVREGFADSPLVSGDEDQLRQAVLNLCLNAVQAMPEGGTLLVRAGRDEGRASLEVRDTGPGIPPEDAPRVFDPFFARGPGMGMGLPIAFAVAQRHGGTLEVLPTQGRGAALRLLLPQVQTGSVNPG